MSASVDQEIQYLSGAANLAEGRQRFAKIVSRANELITEREIEFWGEFVDAYAASQKQPSHGSREQEDAHAKLLGEIKSFVKGKDKP